MPEPTILRAHPRPVLHIRPPSVRVLGELDRLAAEYLSRLIGHASRKQLSRCGVEGMSAYAVARAKQGHACPIRRTLRLMAVAHATGVPRAVLELGSVVMADAADVIAGSDPVDVETTRRLLDEAGASCRAAAAGIRTLRLERAA